MNLRPLPHAVLLVLTAIGATSGMRTAPAQDDPLLEESRRVTVEFASRMQSALQQGMASGGPVSAIGVCKDIAPDIAARLSAESGASVSRTSLKVRNPDNAAEDWQKTVLHQFESGDRQEFFERSGESGARYMKAIPTAGLCLNCHGTVLPPEVSARLKEAYPDDKATGYYLGDIRGAFSVVWPDTK